MKYLFISPHVDDSELMAGGTIAKLIEDGHEVDVIALSHIYEEINISHEFGNSMSILKPYTCMMNNFKARLFHEQSNNILQYLFRIAKTKYDTIFIPSPTDYHLDHSVVARAAIRVFKHCNLLAWLPDWNQRKFIKNYFVKLEHRHVQKKLESLACYKSQLHRPYFNQDVIVGGMHVNGMMCQSTFAEAFHVINMVHA